MPAALYLQMGTGTTTFTRTRGTPCFLWCTESHNSSGCNGPLIQFTLPAASRDILSYTRLLRGPPNLTLNVSRSIFLPNTSLSNLFQCFITLIVKTFSLISNLNQPSCLHCKSPESYTGCLLTHPIHLLDTICFPPAAQPLEKQVHPSSTYFFRTVFFINCKEKRVSNNSIGFSSVCQQHLPPPVILEKPQGVFHTMFICLVMKETQEGPTTALFLWQSNTDPLLQWLKETPQVQQGMRLEMLSLLMWRINNRSLLRKRWIIYTRRLIWEQDEAAGTLPLFVSLQQRVFLIRGHKPTWGRQNDINCKPKAHQVAHQCSYQICWDPSQWWVLSPHHLCYHSIRKDRTCRNIQASGRKQISEKDNTLLRTVSCMAWFKHGSSHIWGLLLELCCHPRKTAIPPATW